MVSGKYAALSGAVARQQAMENIANNLANINNIGFKKDEISFEAILRSQSQQRQGHGINYARVRTVRTDQTQGNLRQTGNSLDLAIEGPGFFKVRTPRGDRFTRRGDCVLDANGFLRTSDGFILLDRSGQTVQVAEAQGARIGIDETGGISVNGQPPEAFIGLYGINDQTKLKKEGNSLFKLEKGGTARPLPAGKIVQGSLESANVNMMEEMVNMITTQRRYEALHKVMKSYSTLDEKWSELGTV